MTNEILSVEPTHGGLLLRYASGGCRTIGVGKDAVVMHYTQETVTYKQDGKTKIFNLKTGGVRVLG